MKNEDRECESKCMKGAIVDMGPRPAIYYAICLYND